MSGAAIAVVRASWKSRAARDAADHGPDRPADEADFHPGLGAIARAGEAARRAGAVVDGRRGPLGADAAS
ncbi:hypothetical protein [Streptomyces sp. Agncl-13]|uniref:hypothetical protein n=1 Tax=Streptomyces sp. Agncl-13 TaxID=3400628 RepID=UPI003A8AB52E